SRMAAMIAAPGRGVNVSELRVGTQRLADSGARAPARGETRERLPEARRRRCRRVDTRRQERRAVPGEVCRIDCIVREQAGLQAAPEAAVIGNLRDRGRVDLPLNREIEALVGRWPGCLAP